MINAGKLCWMNVKKGVEDGSITEEGGVPCV